MNTFNRSKTIDYGRSSNLSNTRTENNITILDRTVYRFKVIILGDIAVGKSSILCRYVEDKYTAEYKCNVGVEFKVKSLFIDRQTAADLQIWDTCGEERFRTITRQYYRDSQGVLLVFDLSNKNSFYNLEKWIDEIREHGPKDVNIIIVGNKSDLVEEREVSFIEASNWALQHNLTYLEVSAKTGNNVANTFEIMAKNIVKRTEELNNRKKNKGKIDKSHVTLNNSITVEKMYSNRHSLVNSKFQIGEGKKKKCC